MPRNDEIIIVIARFIYKSKQSIFWNCAYLNNNVALAHCVNNLNINKQGTKVALLLKMLTNSKFGLLNIFANSGLYPQIFAMTIIIDKVNFSKH